MTSPIPSPPAYDPRPIDAIVNAALAAGWPHRGAFEAGMFLLCHGVSVEEAVAAFELCGRVIQ